MFLPRSAQQDWQNQSRDSTESSSSKNRLDLASQESPGKGARTPRKGCCMKLAAAIPTPGDILRSFVVWLRVHPKTRYLLIFSAICTISYFFVNDMAWASTEDRITEHTLSMPLDGITDSDGVPIWRYLDIPMDPGNGPTYIARTIRSTLAGFLW